MEPLTVLSLFDGISCGRVALQRANIPVAKYYASEIDKYAIQVTMKNYPDTIQLGDVKNVWARNLPKIDLLIGGSPCQDLSVAKNGRKGLKGSRSILFWHYVRLLRTCKPKWFLLENVASMPKEAKEIITRELGVEPILINSALLSAQQRNRLYWTNIPNIKQPEDKNLFLKDILEYGCAMSNKSHAIISSIGRTTTREFFIKNQGELKAKRLGGFYNQNSRWGVYDKEYKSPTLTASMGMGGGFVPMYAEETPKENAYYYVKDKQSFVRGKNCAIDLPDGHYRFFKLTPVECERLQTLPDNYTDGISNSQRYKCIGNGWTVDVIAHIFSFMVAK